MCYVLENGAVAISLEGMYRVQMGIVLRRDGVRDRRRVKGRKSRRHSMVKTGKEGDKERTTEREARGGCVRNKGRDRGGLCEE
jgi:hypothetical protein